MREALTHDVAHDVAHVAHVAWMGGVRTWRAEFFGILASVHLTVPMCMLP